MKDEEFVVQCADAVRMILHSSFFTLNYLKNMYLFRNKFVALLLVITPKSFWPMKKLSSLFSLFLLIPLFAVASEVGDRTIPAEVAQLADSLKQKFAPDKRVALFDVDYSFSGKIRM